MSNTEHGDNYNYVEFESNGRTVQVEWSFSTEWSSSSGGTFKDVLVMEFFVRIPDDYDGLVFCAVPVAESLEEFRETSSDPDGDGLSGQFAIEDAGDNSLRCRFD